MKLITSNLDKYNIFKNLIDYLNVKLVYDKRRCEIMQDDDPLQVLEKKAYYFYKLYKSSVLVDDFSFYLDSYRNFPGVYTKFIIKTLGVNGLIKLLSSEPTSTCTAVVRIGFWDGKELVYSEGKATGYLQHSEFSDSFDKENNLPLSKCFHCNDEHGIFIARFHALKRISRYLLEDTCPFCCEFSSNCQQSIFRKYFKNIKHRFIDVTKYFFLFPPLGQFIEGALILATKDHYTSFAELDYEMLNNLVSYLNDITILVQRIYQVTPIVFEHGSCKNFLKGSTIDHAHLNIFPINIDLHSYLSHKFQYVKINSLMELPKFRGKNYIFVQSNNKEIFVYIINSEIPSQYIRRVIAEIMDMGNMWDWRKYIGTEEIIKTIDKYKKSL